MSPPITITPGLKKLTHAGEHLAERAAGVADQPDRARLAGAHEARRRRGCASASTPASASRCASARPPATASRQPMLPQRQTTSSWPATRMWPMSPAAPWAPRWMRPSATIPQPMPVPTLTNSRCSVSRQCVQCSPSAMMLTSLSTSTGAP